MSDRSKPDIGALTAILDAAEAKVEDAMHALDAAVAGLAVLVGPLAAAHACALAALDLSKQAEKEGRL
ncbi:UNVERIFIED_ORG: hypothetical protein LHK14_00400 [Roseateles sp. XES5]|nr:hypothetical protein [Roseateles sp. XES5]